jgi:hypothetical protein
LHKLNKNQILIYKEVEMNNNLQSYAREQLKEDLSQLPEGSQKMFKRMYSHGNLDTDINTVVDNMPEEKLDWAMQQVEKSLVKLS